MAPLGFEKPLGENFMENPPGKATSFQLGKNDIIEVKSWREDDGYLGG